MWPTVRQEVMVTFQRSNSAEVSLLWPSCAGHTQDQTMNTCGNYHLMEIAFACSKINSEVELCFEGSSIFPDER